MNWLVITDKNDFSKSIEKISNSIDKIECDVCDFSFDSLIEKSKELLKVAGCVFFTENTDQIKDEFISNLSAFSGLLIAQGIVIYTNLSILSNIKKFNEEGVLIFENKDDLVKAFEDNYSTLIKSAEKRIAKDSLLDRGIPFTSDCFATYIAKNKIEIVNEFLSAGMSVNSRDDVGTPMLNIACRHDNFEFVEMILNLGAELNAVSEDRGYTAVMDAVWRGNEKITKYLIEKGAELNTINKEGQTNLILAVGANRENLCKLLAENGADPDVKDMMGMSAYTYATLFKKTRIVEILQPYHKES